MLNIGLLHNTFLFFTDIFLIYFQICLCQYVVICFIWTFFSFELFIVLMNPSFSILLEFPAFVTCVTNIKTMVFVAWSQALNRLNIWHYDQDCHIYHRHQNSNNPLHIRNLLKLCSPCYMPHWLQQLDIFSGMHSIVFNLAIELQLIKTIMPFSCKYCHSKKPLLKV